MNFFHMDQKTIEKVLLSHFMDRYDASLISRIVPMASKQFCDFIGESDTKNVITFSLHLSEITQASVSEIVPLVHELNQAWWVTNYVKPYGFDKDEYRKMWFYNESEGICDYFDGRGPHHSDVIVDSLKYHAIPRFVICNGKYCPVRISEIINIVSEETTLLLPDTIQSLTFFNLGRMMYRPKKLKSIWVDPENPIFRSEDGNLYLKQNNESNPTGEKKLVLSHDLITSHGPIIKD